MAAKETKKKVILDLFLGGIRNISYEGRLLGLITEEEFMILIGSDDMKKRLLNSATVSLSNIIEGNTDISDYRVVINVRKKDNLHVTNGRLFITEKLGLISEFSEERNEMSVSSNGSWYMFKEEDD